MNKKVVNRVLERSKGLCELCESHDRVQLHHILGGNGKRKQHETAQSVIALCYDHHHGTYGVHGKNGHELSLTLKQNLQQTYFNMGYTEEEVKRLMGGKFYD